MGTPPCFQPCFSKGNNFYDFLFTFLDNKSFAEGSAVKGKNLLLLEQIHSFNSRPPLGKGGGGKMKIEQLLPLREYPFTLIGIKGQN